MRGQKVTNGRTIMERCRTFAYFSDGTHAHRGMSSAKAVRGQGSSRARRTRRATHVLAREEHGLADAQARRPATAPSSRTRRQRARPWQAPEASQGPWRGVAQTAIRPDCFQPGSPSQRVEPRPRVGRSGCLPDRLRSSTYYVADGRPRDVHGIAPSVRSGRSGAEWARGGPASRAAGAAMALAYLGLGCHSSGQPHL